MAKNVSLIPMRPDTVPKTLSIDEQNALTWYVLSGCAKEEAVILFMRPDMSKSKAKAAVKEYVKQFFSRKDVREYMDAYAALIDDTLHPKKRQQQDLTGTVEEKKAKALGKLVEYVLSEANDIENAEDPKSILDYANRIGLFDTEIDAPEEPRRYLPKSCGDHCAYRMFCEENTEDMCQYCRYHKFGEDNGIHYEKNNILDVPELESSGTEIAG